MRIHTFTKENLPVLKEIEDTLFKKYSARFKVISDIRVSIDSHYFDDVPGNVAFYLKVNIITKNREYEYLEFGHSELVLSKSFLLDLEIESKGMVYSATTIAEKMIVDKLLQYIIKENKKYN